MIVDEGPMEVMCVKLEAVKPKGLKSGSEEQLALVELPPIQKSKIMWFPIFAPSTVILIIQHRWTHAIHEV